MPFLETTLELGTISPDAEVLASFELGCCDNWTSPAPLLLDSFPPSSEVISVLVCDLFFEPTVTFYHLNQSQPASLRSQ